MTRHSFRSVLTPVAILAVVSVLASEAFAIWLFPPNENPPQTAATYGSAPDPHSGNPDELDGKYSITPQGGGMSVSVTARGECRASGYCPGTAPTEGIELTGTLTVSGTKMVQGQPANFTAIHQTTKTVCPPKKTEVTLSVGVDAGSTITSVAVDIGIKCRCCVGGLPPIPYDPADPDASWTGIIVAAP